MQPFAAYFALVVMKRQDDRDEVQAPPRFTPSQEWIDAFHAQYSETLVQLAAEYAATLDAGIGSRQPRDKRYPHALVLRVLTDTQLGIYRWDHTTPLKDHVLRVIRNRSQIDWKRARKRAERRYRHLSIDDTTNGRSHALDEADRLMFERLTDRQKALAAIRELSERAAFDPELSAFIVAYCHEGSRAEVLRKTGLSGERYRQVQRRLAQLIRQLSVEARPTRDSKERTS